ncbi:MAG: BamA/TamA family outer membrane protein, partial [Cyanobacteria bacterium]|nr:BamA/TamA family outer membrane protein [Cyanobacteriota bacterium]
GLSGATFAKFGGSVSKYIPVAKGTTLAFGASGGSALGGVPQFAQYRLGGWNGIRGYRQFSDLGVGSSMLMATAEIRQELPIPTNTKVGKIIKDHVKAAAFFDVGRVSGNSLSNTLLGRGNTGASLGVGLRLKVPMMGLVRLDYGMPLIRNALGDFTPRWNIGFGEKF